MAHTRKILSTKRSSLHEKVLSSVLHNCYILTFVSFYYWHFLYPSKFQVTEEVRKKWETSSYNLLTCYWLDVQIIYNWNRLIIVFLICFSLILIFSFLGKKIVTEWANDVGCRQKKKKILLKYANKQILSASLLICFKVL